ncbi:MAG: hypothetical protein NT074_04165 [Methanomicrobiales archaeon]|nr:hypothetical protein [Methanomicrobiales archaeon]
MKFFDKKFVDRRMEIPTGRVICVAEVIRGPLRRISLLPEKNKKVRPAFESEIKEALEPEHGGEFLPEKSA